jgi:hypothetical protein
MDTLCTICNNKQYTKYTCPQCHIQYCSLSCYKVHNKQCTNAFQVRQLHEVLDKKVVSPQVRQQTMKMLHDFYQKQQQLEEEQQQYLTSTDNEEEENVFDKISDEELEILVQQLTVNDNLDDIDLPVSIQQDFQKALKDGRMTSWLKMYTPWWIKEGDQIDQITEPLPALSTIASKVSPLIPYYLIELVYGYAYLLRIFNGDIDKDDIELLPDFIYSLLILCPNSLYIIDPKKKSDTHPPKQYENISHVIATVIEYSRNPHVFNRMKYSVDIIEDVSVIVGHKRFAMRLCQELYQLISDTVTTNNTNNNLSLSKQQLKQLERKLYFYLVWCNDQTEQYFTKLGEQIIQEHEQQKQLITQ